MPDAPGESPKQYQLNSSDTRHIGDIPLNALNHTDVLKPDSGAGSYLKDTDETKKTHGYIGKEELADGTIIYYYGNGVKSIHHPDPTKANIKYHANARNVHTEQAQKLSMVDGNSTKAHVSAAHGHSMAIHSKQQQRSESEGGGESSPVQPPTMYEPDLPDPKPQAEASEDTRPSTPRIPPRRSPGAGPRPKDEEKLWKSALAQLSDDAVIQKDGAAVSGLGDGTVAVASDPGVFTPTYGRRGPLKKKNKKSGVDKLDQFLRNGTVQKFAVNLVKEAREELNLQDSENYGTIEKSNAFVAGFDSTVPMRETRPELPKQATKVRSKRDEIPEEERTDKLVKETKENTQEAFYELFKEYFDGLDSAEDSNDSRDSQAGPNKEETSGSDLD